MGIATSTEPIRVLHVMGSTNLGGAESRVMELYRNIDRSRVQFDFLVHTKQEGHYSEEIRSMGGRIYSVPRFQAVNILAYRKALKNFFRTHQEFSVIQGHMTSTAAIYLPIARKAYGKKQLLLIAHARSAGVDNGCKGLLTKLLRIPLKYQADYCFTCSREAGIAVYGKRWVKAGRVWTIPNAIDCERFAYCQDIRHEVRRELSLDNKFVLGHVGRFGFMKNHSYLIDIYAALYHKDSNLALAFIGKGELEQDIHNKIKQLSEEFDNPQAFIDSILFLGNRYDVERYYQGFDYFVFPSTFEGLPGSVVEAQAAGLRCLISDAVTREVVLTNLVTQRSIKEKPEEWAKEIIGNRTSALTRTSSLDTLAKEGFDVRQQAECMVKFYETGKNPPGHRTR